MPQYLKVGDDYIEFPEGASKDVMKEAAAKFSANRASQATEEAQPNLLDVERESGMAQESGVIDPFQTIQRGGIESAPLGVMRKRS